MSGPSISLARDESLQELHRPYLRSSLDFSNNLKRQDDSKEKLYKGLIAIFSLLGQFGSQLLADQFFD